MQDNDEQEQSTEEESFADLFEQSAKKGARLEPGQKISARILKISSEYIFIDTGQKGEGIVDKKEFLDLDGNLTVKEGDSIAAFFISSSHGEMRFTTRIGGKAAGNSQLEEAWNSGIPVEGMVEKEIKGGFEVKLGGTARAFCPHSQIALRRLENSEAIIGSRLQFRITNYSENGRNIVVSRRILLEEEQRQLKDQIKAGLSEGMAVTGTVTSLQSFGAFVDIGGLEGLIPMSELGWSRVSNVADVLEVGQTVQVRIKSIDQEKERISLSLKDTLPDPWSLAAENFPEGTFHTGSVTRLTPFGAFVMLGSGVEGLIHISKLGAGKKVNHPREVLKEGEAVEVKIEGLDPSSRRISLSLAGAARAADEEEATLAEYRRQAGEVSKGMGTLGDLLMSRKNKNK